MSLVLGIDIGGTKVAGGVVAADGTIVATARRATPGASVTDTEDAIAAVLAAIERARPGEQLQLHEGAPPLCWSTRLPFPDPTAAGCGRRLANGG